ncbi:MAG: rhomboid family intrarane serine protease, partial [Nocardioidaceae bacterium]|nr:rhomboid family intrarane serine protease [Nocardioidaceae bacterium]
MRDASVGFQCPNCIAEGRKSTRAARTIAGGTVPAKVGSITTAIIAINVAVFVITTATGGSTSWLFYQGAMLAESGFTATGLRSEER